VSLTAFCHWAVLVVSAFVGVGCSHDSAHNSPDLAAPDSLSSEPAQSDSVAPDTASDSTPPDSISSGTGTGSGLTPLPAPQHLLASSMSSSEVRLSWKDASASESGFEIARSTSGSAGPYLVVAAVSSNVTRFSNSGLSGGRTYCYWVRAKAGGGAGSSPASNQACTATMSGTAPPVRVVTFGDSNTDWGLNGTDPRVLARSYVSDGAYLAAMNPHSPDQLAGKIESQWRGVRANAIRVVNHAIAGTTTGGGTFGGPNRHSSGAPQARTLVSGVTRFEGEVLGLKWPWSGGEPVTSKYVNGPLRRVQAFVPTANDFVYVSIGTNDPAQRISADQTFANLRWMIERWQAAGRRPDHFLLTTLAPRAGSQGASIPSLNTGIRSLAAAKGVVLIDLATYTSPDNGRSWRSSSLHVGDGVHYSESVREWLAGQVVMQIRSRVP